MSKKFEIIIKSTVIALMPIAFVAGFLFRLRADYYKTIEEMPLYTNGFSQDINGVVYSTGHIARQIEKYLYVKIPEQATDLYCAIGYSFAGHYFYSALTLPSEREAEIFIEWQFGVSLEEFKECTEIPTIFLKGPNRWPASLKGNWDLEKYEGFYVCEDTGFGYQNIVYVPEFHRIFIYDK